VVLETNGNFSVVSAPPRAEGAALEAAVRRGLGDAV
jgi:hypothetical protein